MVTLPFALNLASILPASLAPHLAHLPLTLGVGNGLDVPITAALSVFWVTLVWVLPPKYGLIPLAIAMCSYPSCLPLDPTGTLNLPRVVGLATLIRCLSSSDIRSQFRWTLADTACTLYFLCLTVVAAMTAVDPTAGIINRAGFFLSGIVPYWCARLLLTDRDRLYPLLKSLLALAVVLAVMGVVEMLVGVNIFAKLVNDERVLPTMMREFMGTLHNRATGCFEHFIMFGWFFALLMAVMTNLYWQKRKLMPWVLGMIFLPIGATSTISAGPMTMGMLSIGVTLLFWLRQYWKAMLTVVVVGFVAMELGSNRGAMQMVADAGFDASSSNFRVNLFNFTVSGPGMAGHWWTGYGNEGLVPQIYGDTDQSFGGDHHDLCIHWIYLVVYYGIPGMAGFHLFVFACLAALWQAKKRAHSTADQWLLWTLMSTIVGSLLAMQLVSLFGALYNFYHLYLGIAASAVFMVGKESVRYVGVMAEVDGKQVLLRYALKPGQRLVVVRDPNGAGAKPGAVAAEPAEVVPLPAPVGAGAL